MSTGFKPIIISLLLVGLFAFALINAGILFGINNNATQNIGDDPALTEYQASLEENLRSAYDTANASETAFGDSPISLLQVVFVDALGGIWKTLKTIPIAIWNLTAGMFTSYVAPSPQFAVVFSVLSAILIISILFGVWRMISTGDGG